MVLSGYRSWPGLPTDILSLIADRLAIIELLSFRGTCKDFRLASVKASAKTESSKTPWLLVYKSVSPECQLYNGNEKAIYKRNIPDLQDATFLASYQGWLLISKGKSKFFFSPISLAKIELPALNKEVTRNAGALTDVPTSPLCMVCIIVPIDVTCVEFNLISKGESEWTQHRISVYIPIDMSRPFSTATFDHKRQTFYYITNLISTLAFSVEAKRVDAYRHFNSLPKNFSLSLIRLRYDIDMAGGLPELALANDKCHEICGLRYQLNSCEQYQYLQSVEYTSMTQRKTQALTVVWIQPWFFDADLKLHWW